MTDPKLYHCPFCLNRRVLLKEHRDKRYVVECPRCGAKGPAGRGISESKEMAAAAWNASPKGKEAVRRMFRHEVRPL
jgi:hypothetical protein